MGKTVAVIGGGIVGVAAFISQVRHRAASKIYLVNPGPIGLGKAFATTEGRLLTNTSIDTLSVIADMKDDFLKYLKSRNLDVTSSSCVPRYYVSQYARERYEKYCCIAWKHGIAHEHIRSNAVSIRKRAGRGYQVITEDGSAIHADYVLVCCGFVGPYVPESIRGHVGEKGMFVSPYPEGALLDSIPKKSHVLIFGTRLSAIDAAILLCSYGHSAVMASRSGQLPAVRTRLLRNLPRSIDERAFCSLDFTSPLLYRRLLRIICTAVGKTPGRPLSRQISRSSDILTRLRTEVELAESSRNDWQNIIVNLLELANRVLVAEHPEVQKRAIENCWGIVQRYLFSVPVVNARSLLKFMEESRLKILAGTPFRVERGTDEWWVTWSEHGEPERFDAVVCATGFRRPRFHVEQDALNIIVDEATACVEPTVAPDLRVSFRNDASLENIWLLGVSSYLRSPLVSIVYQGAQQAESVALSLAGKSDSNILTLSAASSRKGELDGPRRITSR